MVMLACAPHCPMQPPEPSKPPQRMFCESNALLLSCSKSLSRREQWGLLSTQINTLELCFAALNCPPAQPVVRGTGILEELTGRYHSHRGMCNSHSQVPGSGGVWGTCMSKKPSRLPLMGTVLAPYVGLPHIEGDPRDTGRGESAGSQ